MGNIERMFYLYLYSYGLAWHDMTWHSTTLVWYENGDAVAYMWVIASQKCSHIFKSQLVLVKHVARLYI